MEKEMGKLLKDVATKHRNQLFKIAQKNVKRNEDGLTVIEKDDPWRDDEDETESFKLLRDNKERVFALR